MEERSRNSFISSDLFTIPSQSAVAIRVYEPEAGSLPDKYEALCAEQRMHPSSQPDVARRIDRSEARTLADKYESVCLSKKLNRVCYSRHVPCPNMNCVSHALNSDDITPSLASLLDLLDLARRDTGIHSCLTQTFTNDENY